MTEVAKRLLAKARALGLNRALVLLFVALFVLFAIQGWRFIFAAFGSRGLAERVRVGLIAPERTDRKALNDYDPILDKGLLGKREKSEGPGPARAANVFGVLGSKALIGSSPNDAKLFAVGADLPGGEKLVEIGTAEVVLEKDGNKRTVKVFPNPSGPPAGPPGSPTGAPARPGGGAPGGPPGSPMGAPPGTPAGVATPPSPVPAPEPPKSG